MMRTESTTGTGFVSHLEAALDGTRLPARTIQTTHEGRPLVVRYDLDAIAATVPRGVLATRPLDMWRYRELLPVEDDCNIVSLVETMTPLIACPRLGESIGGKRISIKDESRLPTGSFKSRGMAMAVSMAKQFGIEHVAAPTAGNAGGALAAYAARAGMVCSVFMPEDTPVVNQLEAAVYGAKAYRVNGLINDCGRIVRDGCESVGWFDMSTLKEPYRIEGKKTMGLELAEQLGWRLPDAIFYPTGGGTGLIGMWKAFAELARIGWLEGDPDARPRMYACQSSGCGPIVNAFDAGERFAKPPDKPHTVASGLRVPVAVGDFMIIDAVRESGGAALTAEEDAILPMMRRASATEGIAICPETAACLVALEGAIRVGTVRPTEHVVVFNTGAVQKYVEAMHADLPSVDCTGPIDYSTL